MDLKAFSSAELLMAIQIPSSTKLVWHPCYVGYFCAMLDVRYFSSEIFSELKY